MKERLLGSQRGTDSMAMESFNERDNLLEHTSRPGSNQFNSDGYHISPTHQRTPLVPRDLGEDFSIDCEESECTRPLDPKKPKNAKTSLFIVSSLVYALLLIVICISYVISDVTTHQLPIMYYEGFFTYLYGASILFLLYVFCFLLQESTCCSGGGAKQPKPPKEKKPKKQKPKKSDSKDKSDEKAAEGAPKEEKGKSSGKEKEKGGKPSPYQETQPEAEAALSPKQRKRKTTQDAHGSFFLRVGAIAFGLGSLIYIGLEFGAFFETPIESPCHEILRGVNPLLQMIFTFMQMYFIFMNSRLNIHRFKVLARFGLMHVAATNICVWIRTLVKESLNELTRYYLDRVHVPEKNQFAEDLRQHTLLHAGQTLGVEFGPANPQAEWINKPSRSLSSPAIHAEESHGNLLDRLIQGTTEKISTVASTLASTARTSPSTTTTTTTTTLPPPTTTTEQITTTVRSYFQDNFNAINSGFNFVKDSIIDTTTATSTTTQAPIFEETVTSPQSSGILDGVINSVSDNIKSFADLRPDPTSNIDYNFPALDSILPKPEAYSQLSTLAPFHENATSCGRVNIMGTIVEDSTPYLYPFIIEYSLIGVVVIYVMWKHGRGSS